MFTRIIISQIKKRSKPNDRDSDSTDELESAVLGINIYDDYIEIELGE